MLNTEYFYKIHHGSPSYTALSKELLADLETAIDEFCNDLTFIYHDNERDGKSPTHVPPVEGPWVALDNVVRHHLTTYILCDTYATAAHLAYVCNFYKFITQPYEKE